MHIDCPRAKSDMTPCVLRDGELAADDRGCCVGCGERIDKSAPQTGGGDALKRPKIKLDELLAGHTVEMNHGDVWESPQTGGSDAGERARALDVLKKAGVAITTTDFVDALSAALRDSRREGAARIKALEADYADTVQCLTNERTIFMQKLAEAHREAEAMRDACAKAARGPGGHDDCDHGAGYMDGRLDAALAVEALPIPGKTE